MASRMVGAAIGGGLVIGFAATLYAAGVRSPPPSSIGPDPGTQAVRVSHRRQTVAECRHVVPQSCATRLREDDTATVIRFVRMSAKQPAALHPGSATVRLAFPNKHGQQEQVARVPIGRWLVDWPGAPRLEKLDVRADSRLEIVLTTVSGACVQNGQRCDLVSGVRERRIRITEAK